MLREHSDKLYKLGDPIPEDRPWAFGDTWAEETVGDHQRLIIAPRANHVSILARLVHIMQEPMWLLYVLVVPRGGGEAGRYQSSESQSHQEVALFLGEFGRFLEADGRHNLWIRSVADGAMLVYDRHNLIYGYGHLEEWKLLLAQIGMREVPAGTIKIPVPHSHHYHEAFDGEESRVLTYLQWRQSPLSEQDER